MRDYPGRVESVWSGLVWSGLVWSGLVWSGLVWSGLVRSGQVRSGQVWSSQVRSGPVWSGQVRSGPVRSGSGRVFVVFIGGNSPHIKKRNNSTYHEREASRLWGIIRVGDSQSGLVWYWQ